MIVLILAIIVAGVCHYNFKNNTATGTDTVEGYIKKVYIDGNSSTILICDDLKNAWNEEYIGDWCLSVKENTIISDGRTLDSLKQGEHIIATYDGYYAETDPAQIDYTMLIQFIK